MLKHICQPQNALNTGRLQWFLCGFQVVILAMLKWTNNYRQVQKSDQINLDRQSGSGQLGSTRIDSDRLG